MMSEVLPVLRDPSRPIDVNRGASGSDIGELDAMATFVSGERFGRAFV